MERPLLHGTVGPVALDHEGVAVGLDLGIAGAACVQMRAQSRRRFGQDGVGIFQPAQPVAEPEQEHPLDTSTAAHHRPRAHALVPVPQPVATTDTIFRGARRKAASGRGVSARANDAGSPSSQRTHPHRTRPTTTRSAGSSTGSRSSCGAFGAAPKTSNSLPKEIRHESEDRPYRFRRPRRRRRRGACRGHDVPAGGVRDRHHLR
jgi:hypothetical protein